MREGRFKSIQWPTALLVGAGVGLVFLFAAHGFPWFASGIISPSIMGRDVKPPEVADAPWSFKMIGWHLALSGHYAAIIALLVTRMRGIVAILVGGLIGSVLYLANYYVFRQVLAGSEAQSEVATLVVHVAFGMAAAGMYVGLVKPRIPA